MTTALVVGKFAPLHRGHQDMIEAAAEMSDHLVVLCWARPDFTFADSETRAAWIRTLYPNTTVIVPADPSEDDAPGEVHRDFCANVLAAEGISIDLVVSAEDYGDPLAERLGAIHHRLDRTERGISGTMVRADPHGCAEHLDPLVYASFVKKVVLLGAESTGKSTLAKALAERFGTAWVHEYGREYYELRGGRLNLEDYVEIARVHRSREDEAARSAREWLFVDTNALTTMMFSHLYDRDSLDELRLLAAECADRYALTLVCDDDIAFEQDGWRDTDDWRGRMQGLVLADLAVREIPYVVVSGDLEQRLATATAALTGAITPSLHPPVHPVHPGDLGPRSEAPPVR